MPTILLLLLCLTGHVFAREPPDVDCFVVHLKYVKCSWIKQGPPEVNYTFSSYFSNVNECNCTSYVSENSTVTGCNQPYGELMMKRFQTFTTRLTHCNRTVKKDHYLKDKVLLFPPTNLTVQNESDYNLWFYWNQTVAHCVESKVRFRTNNKNWETSLVTIGRQSFCINLPSSSSQYELQVQSRIGKDCGQSLFWSDWSEPAVWGFNNSTDINAQIYSTSVWTPLLYVIPAVTLVLLATMLLYHERLRLIPMSVVPKPSLVLYDIEDWLQFSKGLKGNFKTNYNEYACPVREYCHVSQSDSESSDGSNMSVATNQTDCSGSIPVNESEDSSPCSSSSSTVLVSPEEEL